METDWRGLLPFAWFLIIIGGKKITWKFKILMKEGPQRKAFKGWANLKILIPWLAEPSLFSLKATVKEAYVFMHR